MGVWDMIYLVQQYKKALSLAENQHFSEKTRNEFLEKAEHLRIQMAHYLERVEKRQEARE
jgi:hypothetical protein